ncbi:MAG: hypothetical protein IJS60_05515, partial [Abditibacteriota bacterium]|nr:hypothetical protein [Abditibacteriota bacterium]
TLNIPIVASIISSTFFVLYCVLVYFTESLMFCSIIRFIFDFLDRDFKIKYSFSLLLFLCLNVIIFAFKIFYFLKFDIPWGIQCDYVYLILVSLIPIEFVVFFVIYYIFMVVNYTYKPYVNVFKIEFSQEAKLAIKWTMFFSLLFLVLFCVGMYKYINYEDLHDDFMYMEYGIRDCLYLNLKYLIHDICEIYLHPYHYFFLNMPF